MKYKIKIVISDSIDRETLVEFLSEYRICVCDEANGYRRKRRTAFH